ncbi:PAS domain-containing sensor histidine kinase [Methanolobus bombayensis]|uniref:PAS domain-containing sensor histidine kinase n=1 Tax=Methanolobus bombayensis TaxID=38023 RepID=UPI001AE30F6C|nr:PAS domain-containing sensor histidine kinase [Methanolobus bombayensis]MBP1909835.1 PAS domain S-box-containing protein [Methanolobus bombayensis]
MIAKDKIKEEKPGEQDKQIIIEKLNETVTNLTSKLETAESKLKSTEDFYTERLNNLNDVLFSVDEEGVFTYINPAIENITGYTIEEVLGTHFTKHVHPDDICGLLEDIDRTVAGEHKPYMFRIVKKDGNISYVHTTSRPIIKDGEFKGINGLMVDIARLKKVEVRLKEERDRAQNYLDIVGVIILVIDTAGNIKLINKKGCEVFGCKECQLISSNWFDLAYSDELKEAWKKDYNNFILGKKPFKPYFEATIQTKNGERIFAWHNRCIKDEDGNITGVLASGNDITERKKAEQALVFAKLISENANRTKSQFLSNISHELRTPLNLIIGYSDLLHEDYVGATTREQKQYLEVIKRSGNRLLLLLNSMIEMSAVEEGNIELKLKEFSVPVIIKDIKHSTMPMAKKKQINLQFNLDDEVKTIKADKNKIKTVLYNLINNAIKFTPECGNINVNIMKEGKLLNVSVEDDGIGIEKENIDQLFHPFSQIDSSLNRKFEGAGLGLSIVKEFVQMHGGKVQVETEIDKGSKFSFIIPISDEEN